MTQGTLFGECQHLHTVIIPEKRGPHHAREVCSDCRKFLGWVPKPETVLQRKLNTDILSVLAKVDRLTEWEREFVRDLSSKKNISPRQQERLFLLRDKYFAGGKP